MFADVCGNWIEIAYGTSSGTVRVIVQHPETVGHGPQLFQTFTVHRYPVTKVVSYFCSCLSLKGLHLNVLWMMKFKICIQNKLWIDLYFFFYRLLCQRSCWSACAVSTITSAPGQSLDSGEWFQLSLAQLLFLLTKFSQLMKLIPTYIMQLPMIVVSVKWPNVWFRM